MVLRYVVTARAMVSSSSRVQVLADDAHQEDRNDVGENDCVDAACRTMTSVEEIEGRRALISQRECIDASGLTRVSPGSRRVVRYYDE